MSGFRAAGRDGRVVAGLALAAHLLVLGAMTGGDSWIVDHVFRPDGEGILAGAKPYADLGFEYPPLALPFVIAPGAVSDTAQGYREAFAWLMICFDLAIVGLLAFALRGQARRLAGALAVYSAGLFALGGLSINRFDLVPAAFALAAVVARSAGAAPAWGLLLGAGTAVKAFPAFLLPALSRGERRLAPALWAFALPLAVAAGVVIGFGDEFGTAVSYHTGRDLQVESVAASILLVAGKLGAGITVVFGSGSFNLSGTGADAARLLASAATAIGFGAFAWMAWRQRVPPAPAAAGAVAVLVTLGPVLSPQFLIWLLPLSALAFGAGRENLLLLVAVALTRVELERYGDVTALAPRFVWPLVARNVILVAYLLLVVRRCAREAGPAAPSLA